MLIINVALWLICLMVIFLRGKMLNKASLIGWITLAGAETIRIIANRMHLTYNIYQLSIQTGLFVIGALGLIIGQRQKPDMGSSWVYGGIITGIAVGIIAAGVMLFKNP